MQHAYGHAELLNCYAYVQSAVRKLKHEVMIL